MEKRGRPKTAQNKERIGLSIDKDALVKAKETAKILKKTLSQYTEDIYNDMHDSFFGLSKTPEQKILQIQQQLNEIQDIYKNNNPDLYTKSFTNKMKKREEGTS